MTISFKDKVAIVTGSGGGLGRCHALQFAERGAKVVVNDLGGAVDGSGGSSEAAEKVVQEIKDMGGEAIANGSSVTDKAGVSKLVEDAMAAFGRIDILVNNAGVLRDKSFAKVTLDDFEFVVDVHLMGSVYCTKAVWPIMVEQQYGRIIMTSSSSGVFGNFGQSNYGAAKMGIVGLTNVLAIEGAKYNIKVNVIAPTAYTRMTEALLPEDVGKLFSADLVTPMVSYLASEICEPSHEIFGVAAGRFARIGIITHEGYVNTSASAEDIADNIEEIRNIENGTYPLSNEDELMIIQQAIQGNQ